MNYYLLAINWASVGVKASQFILSFSILILLHEFGHFITAKWFGCRVEKFYLFFNPWFSLFKRKKGETEYGLGWIPLGGYVKISGMIDESMDKEQLKQPAQPYEFRSKPAWQRLIIMLGGIIVNVILAIIIFIFILWVWGKEYLPPVNAKYGIVADSLSIQHGLKDGDMVLKVGDKPLEDITRLRGEIVMNEGVHSLFIMRDGKEMTINYDDNLIKSLNSRDVTGFASVRIPFVISKFSNDAPAKKAGLEVGDKIIKVDSLNVLYHDQFIKMMKGKKNEEIKISFLRNNDTMNAIVQLGEGKIGAFPESNLKKLGFVTEKRTYSFIQAIPAGFSECWKTLGRYVTGLKQLFNGKAKATESLGSVISIGSIFPDTWDWQSFWALTAIFSVVLAFMNILPIPGLDGGHALFTIAEIVSGKKPSDRFMEYAQIVGFVLLLGLMAFALGLDIWRIFK